MRWIKRGALLMAEIGGSDRVPVTVLDRSPIGWWVMPRGATEAVEVEAKHLFDPPMRWKP